MAKLPNPKGFLAAGVSAGMRKDASPDVALIVSETPAVAAGATTRNKFFSPSVHAVRRRLAKGKLRAIVANAKFSNAGTGDRGLRDAEEMAALTANAIGVDSIEVAMASTGVIGQFLPMDKIRKGISLAAKSLSPNGWGDAAHAIMTTDNVSKDFGRIVRIGKTDIAIRGIAKGVGMVHPNMATTLCFVATDANLSANNRTHWKLQILNAVDATFNSVTVDGDTSTSDTLIVMANGAAGSPPLAPGSREERKFNEALTDTLRELAVSLVRDGEGVTKLIEMHVSGARSVVEARDAARKVCASNLVKTAVHGCDANWGRIACALGNSRAVFDQLNVSIEILGERVMRKGTPVQYDENALHKKMRKESTIVIKADLGEGKFEATAWGGDMSAEYIRINADYRS